MKTFSLACLALAVFPFSNFSSYGQDVTKETIVEGLNNPCGIAIQPGTNHIFIADSGAQRIVRIVDGKIQDVITGFPKDTYVGAMNFEMGPLGMIFVDNDTLVVGGGGLPDGDEMLRVYKIGAPGADPISADKMESSFTLPADGATVGEGDFFGLVASQKGVYVTCNGDDTKAWIARADLDGNKLSNFRRFIATKEYTETDAPGGITISPEGYLAVGQIGSTGSEKDALLTFYSEEGQLLDKFPTGLHDITALAYGPKRKRLFAVDFSFSNPSNGGLFKLVETNDDAGCAAVKITELDKPTAMVFDKNGDLYVTVCGTPSKIEEKVDNKKSDVEKASEKSNVEKSSDESTDKPEESEPLEDVDDQAAPAGPGQLIKIVGLDNPPRGN